ncbi:MerR family transcriptional regulator, partial [Kribbella koreensis]
MELWTLSELAERVEAALTDYPGQANGRVRPVPDQRAIRWYTTTGLIDRPTEMRGRTALYGRRHLLQLVAIKRRQSQGHTLAQIQSELAGAPNQTLEPIAALPNPLPPNSPKV